MLCSPQPGYAAAMPDDNRLSVEDLRAVERQVAAVPADRDGTLLFLKDGMLQVIRTAIAAETELARLHQAAKG